MREYNSYHGSPRPDLHPIETVFNYTPLYNMATPSSPPSTAPIPTPSTQVGFWGYRPQIQRAITTPQSPTMVQQNLARMDLSVPKPPYSIPSPSTSTFSGGRSASIDNPSCAEDPDDQDDVRPITREHVEDWKRVRETAIITTGSKTFVPQSIYQPHTLADRERYIAKASLSPPIVFHVEDPYEWGIPLEDASRMKMKRLIGKEDLMFEDCGPSVSIRIQWPGYDSWTRQIPTKDFRVPKGPITRAKLAKNVANCLRRFIEKKAKEPMHEDAEKKWRVGPRHIKVEDLILVSLHHISQGSWQPQLRLRRDIY
ncbi:hypothetical protein BJ138DRAFT_521918 [Hygrophoropsis aurantiaca]|uniref:Uncharacterized protein n=1 Tax=Hygrophoropsis aurantiaca TaxID=72124 RepID=A0ACB8A2P1_9AGAM|nr:hypothetical protein BJ138DRAFT_521918 [Hygrophoropsis aurantiaca]